MIHYLKRQDIDIDRWDRCIRDARNTLIYGYHYYLDHMAAGQWDALVLDDYTAVMPLTWRRKFGIRYLYQPAFTQQTGIFSTGELTPNLIEAFLAATKQHYRFAEIFLNYANDLTSLKQLVNYILPLDVPYDQLAAGYKKDLVRNLKRTTRLKYHKDHPPSIALTSFREEYEHKIASLGPGDFDRFAQLCAYLQSKNQLIVRSVIGNKQTPGNAPVPGADQTLLATALFLRDQKRLYLLHSTTLPAGRDTEANHFLLDQFIREFADSGLTLDFEGSDIPGIAHFYANFGSRQQPYFYYRRNDLPWPVKWLKRS